MKNKFLLLTIMCLVAISNFAFAQTQSQMNQNYSDSYKKAEQELNTTYQQILKEYASDTSFISHLRAAERLWIKFRDAEVLMKYPPRKDYGSIQSTCVSGYMEQLTRERNKTLKVWLVGIQEGDVCAGSVKMKK